MSEHRSTTPPARRAPLLLLAALFLLPTLQTAVSVHWEWHTPFTYPALKLLMIAAPIATWLIARRSRAEIKERTAWRRTNLLPGVVSGVVMGGVILAVYYAALRPHIDPAPVAAKIRALGIIDYYWAMALVISLWNSLLEEYYWRAFLVGELLAWTRRTRTVCLIAGGLFGMHHVFVLLSATSLPLLVLAVAGMMLAGGVWTWLRLRGHSIFDCYVSHVLADLSIMWIGSDLIRRAG